jgi:hypothetical protein
MLSLSNHPSTSETSSVGLRRFRFGRVAAVSLLVAALSLPAAPALAAAASNTDAPALSFHDGRFEPATLTVPANAPVALHVTNLSGETIEFESFKLNRERVIGPGGTITVQLPALSPGSYDFYDDFHQDVPEGSIVAK